ncbi:hypothetical protein N7452_006679 [Penicillium brevicompactum]|uniref:Uncharacterized protein n=1 Tax=Penicillium brevicompactum TaxID=5074 RepID=A0A9W9UIM2_PENBR|nr:hypothetical protein N7452_006679 [Penicillium brevicompactum]
MLNFNMLSWPTDSTAGAYVPSPSPDTLTNVEPLKLDDPEISTDDKKTKEGKETSCEEIAALKLTLEYKMREADCLRKDLFMAGKQSRSLQRDILMAEEQARRAKEMTEEAIHETDVAMKANRELTAKLVDLQAGFQALTDEEISREFTTLRHDMVQWSFTHFQNPTTPDGHAPLKLSQGGATLKLDEVRLELSKAIHKGFLKPHIVGEGLAGSEHLLDIDLEAQVNCSSHVAHHWRGAMSVAASSLNRGKMEGMVVDLVNHIEEMFGHHSHTLSKRRMNQLHSLIWRCIQLKQKLEVQYDTYVFWSTSRMMPFDEPSMLGSSETKKGNSKVIGSLWPGLVKISPTGHTSIVEKELVETSYDECVAWESESVEDASQL